MQESTHSCFYCDYHNAPAEDRGEFLNDIRLQVIKWRDLGGLLPSEYRAQHGSWTLMYTYEKVIRTVCDMHYYTCEWCDSWYVLPSANHDLPDPIEGDEGNPNGRPWFTIAELRWPHMGDLCRDCGERSEDCERCNRRMHIDEAYSMPGEGYYCYSCYENNTWFCEACDVRNRSGEACYDCDESEDAPRAAYVHDYSYKPDPNFCSLPDEVTSIRTAYMGYELEIEFPKNRHDYTNGAELVTSLANADEYESNVYLKRDGSLEYGFEVVSHPATLAYHQSRDLSWMRRIADEVGARSWGTGTCGLHVHISRSAIRSNVHLYMFWHLFIDNKAQMTRLAGRDSDRWATFDNVRPKIMKVIKGEMNPYRYEAVNLTNWNTIEIRMFRGSLRPERVLMALELTGAAMRYTSTLHTHDVIQHALLWDNFASWVRSNADTYPNLIQYLDKYSL